MSKVAKYFKVDRNLKETFERLCGALGRGESDVLEHLIAEWVSRNKDQARIDLYFPAGAQVIINRPSQVNIAVKAELTYYKLEISRLLEVLETAPDDNRPEFLKQLAREVIRATRIQQNAQDLELGRLLQRAEEYMNGL